MSLHATLIYVITIHHLDLIVQVGTIAQHNEILRKLDLILSKENTIMTDLTSITAAVTETADAEKAAIALLGHLHDLLVAAGTDPAKLADLATSLRTNKDALAAAIVANTPAA